MDVKQRSSVIRWLARSLGVFVCAGTALPVWRANYWWVRVFDFPRLQLTALGAAAVLGLKHHGPVSRVDRWLQRLLPLAIGAQLLHIRRYTPLAYKEVLDRPRASGAPTVSLLTTNVLMSNRQSERLRRRIEQLRPDLVLLMEPDSWWEQQLRGLERDYPHAIKHPLGNTYGLLLYSKLPLLEPQVRFLIRKDVPSIRARVELPDRRFFYFFGVHPKPPGRENWEGEIRGSGPRDAELLKVALEIEQLREPVIVAGDFNDVAWSHTTRRFQRIAQVLDPRVGRGLYNSFHAGHPLLRFPLDHLFHSAHFALSAFERLPDIGSDHFPIYAELSLVPELVGRQHAPRKTEVEPETARAD